MGTTIQGNPTSWADLKTVIAVPNGPTIEIEDMTALSWKRMVERKKVRGSGGRFRGMTTGQADFEVSASFLEAGSAALKSALAQVDPDNLSQIEFSIVAIWTPPRSRRNRKVEIFKACLTEDGIASALGPDETIEELKIETLDIIDYPDAKGPGTRLLK